MYSMTSQSCLVTPLSSLFSLLSLGDNEKWSKHGAGRCREQRSEQRETQESEGERQEKESFCMRVSCVMEMFSIMRERREARGEKEIEESGRNFFFCHTCMLACGRR